MRSFVLAVAAFLGLGMGPALATCPPELLGKMIDQGYSKAEVQELCGAEVGAGRGGGPGTPAGRGAEPEVARAFARLRELTGELEARCASGGGRNVRRTGPCDLAEQYGEIFALWRRGQAKCDGGDAAACRVMGEAAREFLAANP